MKTLIIILFGWVLVGCTSKPLDVRYYLFHVPQKNAQNQALTQSLPIVEVQPVSLADYLRQASLSMQVSQHEMYYSRQDVWAEPLQKSFYKALVQDLNNLNQVHYAQTALNLKPAKDRTKVAVNLQHFHVTDESKVVMSGEYQITPYDISDSIVQSFYFELGLEEDGYPHAVKQLRKLVTMLSVQINQNIQGTMVKTQ